MGGHIIEVCAALKGRVFAPFCSENGYRAQFGLESGMVYERTTVVYQYMCSSFPFQMKEKTECNMRIRNGF